MAIVLLPVTVHLIARALLELEVQSVLMVWTDSLLFYEIVLSPFMNLVQIRRRHDFQFVKTLCIIVAGNPHIPVWQLFGPLRTRKDKGFLYSILRIP